MRRHHRRAPTGQPAVERADLGGVRARVKDALRIAGAVAGEGVGGGHRASADGRSTASKSEGYGASVVDQMASGSMLIANSTAGSASPLVKLRRMPGAGARKMDCTPGYWVSGGSGVCSASRR